MSLEVRHLMLVKAVAEEGNVTKAGHRLHLTQSALSHQLRDIEMRLGTDLFFRHNKRMTLSPAGQRLLQTADNVLAELKRTEDDIERITTKKVGVLRLSTECNTCYHWLPSMLKKFNSKFPSVDVQVLAEATREPIRYLLEGKLDLAIISDPHHSPRLVIEPLFEDRFVVIMHPQHPLAKKAFVSAEDFADQHLFLYSLPKESSTVFKQVLFPAGITPKQVSQIQVTEGIVEMVKAGLGIAVLANWAVEPELKKKTIIAKPLTRNGLKRYWRAAMLKNGGIPDYLHGFIELFAKDRKIQQMKNR